MSRLDGLLNAAQTQRRRRRALVMSAATLVVVIAALIVLTLTYLDRLTFQIAPDAATDKAQVELLDGFGWVLADSLIAVKEDVRLRISSAGFKPVELKVTDSTWRRGKLDVILEPLPAKLVAQTLPELDNVRWYVDDAFVAQAPQLNIELTAGDYTVRAQHPNFESASAPLQLERDQSMSVSLELVPVKGTLEITSVPTGSNVTVDAVAVGSTPVKIEVAGGAHEISLSYPHHVARTDTIEVTTDNLTVSRHYQLVPANEKVTFSLSPKDGLLTLNHVAVPAQQLSGVSLAVNSTNVVQYSKPGYRTEQVEFTVKPNAANVITLDLQAIFGTVEVHSDPVADVSVDGTVYGQTPMNLRLQTFAQTVTLSRPGYVSQSRTITPQQGATETVFVSLVTERDHLMNTAPDTQTNSIGMEFKLFKKPDSVRMGSLQGEPNGLPNEFARQIQLNRPFYAGIHEVTVAQYQQMASPGQASANDRTPVTGISWLAAAKFCNWLSTKEGFTPVYTFSGDTLISSDSKSNGYRLLTEAEWEWLARKAGRLQQVTFPWGNNTTIPANAGNLADESAKVAVSQYIPHYNDGQVGLSDTGLYQANPAGLHDLAGNVSEWTHDSYSLAPPTVSGVEVDPFDESAAKWRTIKGSNFQSAKISELRTAFRRGSQAGDDTVGFRVARYLH